MKNIASKYWRLNNLYYIKSATGRRIRFRMNAVQRYLYVNKHYRNIVLKSRQHGITTTECLDILDDVLFALPGRPVNAGIIAHNLDDAESFFDDKIRYAYENLDPVFALALPNARRDAARNLSFENGSRMRVGTSLRSSTNQRLHISEFGKVCKINPEKAEEIVTGAFPTVHTGMQITIESTAEGAYGYFYDYCMDAYHKQIKRHDAMRNGAKYDPLTPLDFKFFFFAWYHDDRNFLKDAKNISIPDDMREYFAELRKKHGIHLSRGQKVWYVKQREIQRDKMLREYPSTVDEAFQATVRGAYFSASIDLAYENGRMTTKYLYDPNLHVDTYWDIGFNDPTAIWFVQDDGENLRIIDFYMNDHIGLGHYVEVCREKPYTYDRMIAPHDISVSEWSSGKKRKDIAKDKYGIFFEEAPKLSKEDQIECALNVFPKCVFYLPKCDAESVNPEFRGVNALRNYKQRFDQKLGQFVNNQVHDWASHAADAFMLIGVCNNRLNLLHPGGLPV